MERVGHRLNRVFHRRVGRRELAIRQVQEHLQVMTGPKSNVVRAYYLAESPVLVQVVLINLFDVFLGEYVRLSRPQRRGGFFHRTGAAAA